MAGFASPVQWDLSSVARSRASLDLAEGCLGFGVVGVLFKDLLEGGFRLGDLAGELQGLRPADLDQVGLLRLEGEGDVELVDGLVGLLGEEVGVGQEGVALGVVDVDVEAFVAPVLGVRSVLGLGEALGQLLAEGQVVGVVVGQLDQLVDELGVLLAEVDAGQAGDPLRVLGVVLAAQLVEPSRPRRACRPSTGVRPGGRGPGVSGFSGSRAGSRMRSASSS